MSYAIVLHEVILALASALDYVGIDDVSHGKRVARMAAECARVAGWSQAEQDQLILLGLLHDCGVSSTQVHRHLVEEWEWAESEHHARHGSELLQQTGLLAHLALPIRYHHTHWALLHTLGLAESVMRQANLIFLVDRVDALRTQSGDGYEPERWRRVIADHAGTQFAPELCQLFLQASGNDGFWFSLEAEALDGFFVDWLRHAESQPIAYPALLELALMFASIVDGKSRFTYRHSLGVKGVAQLLAQVARLSQAEQECVVLAALLHDLGKLRVADAILDKQGPFDEHERRVMNHHSFDTEQILNRIGGFGEIAHIAAMHHETLDGLGYPRRVKGEEIPIAARIIAVADVFQALVQNRPYRPPLALAAAREVLTQMVARGKLDPELVGLLLLHADEAYRLARQHEPA